MTTSTINHRPTHRPALFLTAAAAVVAIAAGSVALSVSDHPNGPAPQPPFSSGHPQEHTFQLTTSGGRLMPGA